MFWQSSAVIPAHTPGTDGASRAPHLRVSLVAHSASDFAGAAFNPRRQQWSQHFRWNEDGTVIIGLTACGRATVEALKLNNELAKQARALWRDAGIHPP